MPYKEGHRQLLWNYLKRQSEGRDLIGAYKEMGGLNEGDWLEDRQVDAAQLYLGQN